MIKLAYVIRILLFPFLNYVFPIVSTKLKKRLEFEAKNLTFENQISHAEYGFEVSSEGELEQVLTPIEYLLAQNKTIEILFCSPSVEKKCLALHQKYPHLIRLYYYPIVRFNPFSQLYNPLRWMTNKKLFLCRYDFFPELFIYKLKKSVKLILLSGSLQNINIKGFIEKKFLFSCFVMFDQILAATEEDKARFVKISKVDSDLVEVFDFRIVRISQRLILKDQKLISNLPHGELILNSIKSIDPKKKILFGSFWVQEIEGIRAYKKEIKENKLKIYIVPHLLSHENINLFIQEISKLGISYKHIHKESSENEVKEFINSDEASIWLLDIKGILCELYAFFNLSYVGGGYARSIHSVLEPFVAQSNVICGPKVHRSSEYYLIKERFPNHIFIAPEYKDILSFLFNNKELSKVDNDDFIKHYEGHLELLLIWLGIKK